MQHTSDNPIYRAAWRTIAVWVALLVTAVAAIGQTPPGDEPTVESVQVELEQLRATTALDDATKNAAIESLTAALDLLQRAQAARSDYQDFLNKTEEAPARLEALRAEMAEQAEQVSPEAPDDWGLTEIGAAREAAEAELAAAQEALEQLQAEPDRRAVRRAEIPRELANTKQQLAEARESLEVASAEPPPSRAAAARLTALRAEVLHYETQLKKLEQELASYAARELLLPLNRDRQKRIVDRYQSLVTQWSEIEMRRRQTDAEAAASRAERMLVRASEHSALLERVAEENGELAATHKQLVERLAEVSDTLIDARTQLTALRGRAEATRRKVDAAGLTQAISLLLRRELDDLPRLDRLHEDDADYRDEIGEVHYELLVVNERLEEDGEVDERVDDIIDQITEPEDEDRAEVEAFVRELLTTRRNVMLDLHRDYNNLAEELGELDRVTQNAIVAVESYREYIEERVLWVRSVAGDNFAVLGQTGEALAWLLDPAGWRDTLRETWVAMWANPARSLLSLLALIVLTAVRPAVKRRLLDTGKKVNRYATDRFYYTPYAMLLTTLIALPAPLLMWLTGWWFESAAMQPGVAVGVALKRLALLYFSLELVRQSARPGGLAPMHFRWPENGVKRLRRQLGWLITLILPLAAIALTMNAQDNTLFNDSLGRIAFVIGIAILTVFFYRALDPKGPLLQRYLVEHPGGWAARSKALWYWLLVLVPATLGVLAATGYYYTAFQLQRRLDASIWLMLGIIAVNALLLRWLFITRRRLAVAQARKKRETAEAAAEAESEGDGEQIIPAPIEEQDLDLPAVSAQSRQLFAAMTFFAVVIGVVLIWSPVLPALRQLDRVQVWPSVQLLDQAVENTVRDTADAVTPGGATSSNGTPSASGPSLPGYPSIDTGDADKDADPLPNVLTLADVGLALLILAITVVATKNIPGLLEITLLTRLPLDAGLRFAIATIVRYVIAIAGIMLAFNALNIGWTRVQWLAAALTFGLAFGLQEIFANFVSGLIILVERPIRVGDTVTVGAVNGRVSRIRMRATVITDWDMKELIIPNKTFITDQVINWSLSDPVLRVKVPVGISYGADVDLAHKILLEVAAEDPNVLETPEPKALFLEFGDSTLNFELRVFIPSIDHFFPIRDGLHKSIIKRFRAAGIEIAFPQRDLHLRSVEVSVPVRRDDDRH